MNAEPEVEKEPWWVTEPNATVEDCPVCGGNIYTCLWCGFETPSSAEMDEHECEPPEEKPNGVPVWRPVPEVS